MVLADESTLTTNTNPEDGSFSITVPSGTVVVSVQAENYRKTYVVEVESEGIHNVEQSTDCAIPDPLSTGFIIGKVCAPGTADQPLAGAIISARYTGADGVEAFCRDLVEQAGVLLAPGSLFRSSLADTSTDRFRVGVGRSNPEPALEAIERFLER